MSNLNDRESYKREVYETDGSSTDRVIHSNQPDQVTRREVRETVDYNPATVDHTVAPNRDASVEPRYVAGDRDADAVVRPTEVNPTADDRVTPVQNYTARRGPFARRPVHREPVLPNRIDDRLAENQRIRDNDNAARGLMIGVILTSLAGLVIGTLFALTHREQTPQPVAPVVVPNAPASPQVRERVIERDRLVPAPQQQNSTSGGGVTVPSGSGSSQQAPAQTGTQSGQTGATTGTSGSGQTPSNSGTTSSGVNNGSSTGVNTNSGTNSTGTNAGNANGEANQTTSGTGQ